MSPTTSAPRTAKRTGLRHVACFVAGTAPAANAFDRGVVVDTRNGGNATVRTRLPTREQPGMPRSADSVDRPLPAERGEEEYEHHFRFLLGAYTDPRTLGVTPESVTAKILNDFGEEFLHRNRGPQVWGGKQCELDLPGPFDFPIEFDRTRPTGWEFTSLDGTEEGARRRIDRRHRSRGPPPTRRTGVHR